MTRRLNLRQLVRGWNDERVARRGGVALMVALGSIGLFERLQLVERFGRRLTNEDQTLLWAAARAYGRLEFPQPNFWGQRYGTTFEAVPAALARAIGISPATAFPLTLALMGLVIWWAVGLAAWSGGHPVLGVVAFAAPIVLSTQATLVGDLYPPALGRLLAGLVLALVVTRVQRAWVIGAVACLGGFAIVFDTSSAIIVVPAALYAVLRRQSEWKQLVRWAVLGLVPVLGWLLGVALFYRAHPDYDLHPPPLFDPSIDTLGQALAHPADYLRLLSLELWSWWALPLVVGVATFVFVLLTRRLRSCVPAVVLACGVLGVLSTSKALEGFATVYFRKERVLLLLPLGLWFLWFLIAESEAFKPRWAAGAIVLLTLALVAMTVPVRWVRLDAQLADLRRTALLPAQAVSVVAVGDLRTQCAAVRRASRSSGTDLAVFFATGVDRSLAYGCASFGDGSPETLFPTYERRTWRLYEERDRLRTSLLVWRVDAGFCDRATLGSEISGCRVLGGAAGRPRYAVVRTTPRSALRTLHDVGIESRPFGRDCHPRDPTTCSSQTSTIDAGEASPDVEARS